MADITKNSKCAICQKRLGAKGSWMATTGVFVHITDPLYPFCNEPIHWACYASWPDRERFARTYVNFRVATADLNPFWTDVFRNEHAYVQALHGVPGIESMFEVWLYRTGTVIEIPWAKWEGWLHGRWKPADPLHVLESDAISEALPSLRNALPTVKQILATTDWSAKDRLVVGIEAAQEQMLEIAHAPHNEQCQALAERFRRDGFTCPACGKRSPDIRLVDRSPSGKSSLICRKCKKVFQPEDLERGPLM